MKKFIIPIAGGILAWTVIMIGLFGTKPKLNKECRFEGAECPNVQHYLRSYQIQLNMDTMWLYDADKLVGMHIDRDTGMVKHGAYIDSLIWSDNQ